MSLLQQEIRVNKSGTIMNGFRDSAGSKPMTCSGCNEPVPAPAFCENCKDWLCTECVLAHWRVQLTKMHTINLQKCTACCEGLLVKGFCGDCGEWLCEQCIQAHRRVRLTKGHNLQPKDLVRACVCVDCFCCLGRGLLVLTEAVLFPSVLMCFVKESVG